MSLKLPKRRESVVETSKNLRQDIADHAMHRQRSFARLSSVDSIAEDQQLHTEEFDSTEFLVGLSVGGDTISEVNSCSQTITLFSRLPSRCQSF
jgi:hypothetical protein